MQKVIEKLKFNKNFFAACIWKVAYWKKSIATRVTYISLNFVLFLFSHLEISSLLAECKFDPAAASATRLHRFGVGCQCASAESDCERLQRQRSTRREQISRRYGVGQSKREPRRSVDIHLPYHEK